MDRLNIIHVTGTKGKVRDRTQESGVHLGWVVGPAQTRTFLSRAPPVPSLSVSSEAMA